MVYLILFIVVFIAACLVWHFSNKVLDKMLEKNLW